MKLTSMTDFVLEQHNYLTCDEASPKYVEKIVNYANFLKQPLKLEMFVPLSKTGNYLKEVIATEKIYHEELEQAKSKVLFKYITVLENDDKYISFKTKNIAIFVYDKISESFVFQKDWNIERLISLDIELTKSAVKSIFG